MRIVHILYVLNSDNVIITGEKKVENWERGLMRDKGGMRIGFAGVY